MDAKLFVLRGRRNALLTVRQMLLDGVTNKANGRILREHVSDARKFSRQPVIVAIQKGNDLAPAFGNADVECGGLATILFADIP